MVKIELNGELLSEIDENQSIEIDQTEKESKLEYYLNRKGRYYFRNLFHVVSIQSEGIHSFMKGTKYGTKFDFDYD